MCILKNPAGNKVGGEPTTLCWIARITSLTIVSIFYASWAFLGIFSVFSSINGYNPPDILKILEYVLILLTPLLLATIAWRWHLIGGISIILFTIFFLFYILLIWDHSRGSYEYEWPFGFPLLLTVDIVLSIVGFLYLLVWWKEKR